MRGASGLCARQSSFVQCMRKISIKTTCTVKGKEAVKEKEEVKLINPEVRIENTNLCNARCILCPREKLTRPKGVMPLKHFKELVDQSETLGAELISIFGYGEPLLDSTIAQKVQYCASKNLDTFITTNASILMDLKGRELIDSGLSMIRFSVHGLTRETYENVHVGLNWGKTIENIEFFLDHNIRCGSPVKTSISVIPMNGESIDDIRRFWEHRVDYLEIWRPHGWAGGRKYRELNKKKKTCGRPFSGPIQINCDGKVMICCFDTNAEMTVGDTYLDSIEDIVRGEPYREIRRKHSTGHLNGLPCETCDQLSELEESPLLYSNRDKERKINRTSSMKFDLI